MSALLWLVIGVVVGVVAHIPLMALFNKLKDKMK